MKKKTTANTSAMFATVITETVTDNRDDREDAETFPPVLLQL